MRSCCCATGPFAKMCSHNVGISRLITRPARSFWRQGERAQGEDGEKESLEPKQNLYAVSWKARLPWLLIGVYPSTLLFGEHASMRARISRASENCKISLHSGGNGNRVRRTPLRTGPALLLPLFFFLLAPSSLPSSSSSSSSASRFRRKHRRCLTSTSLHGRTLERWPRITVRECRRRPVRHFAWAALTGDAEIKRRESIFFLTLLLIIYNASQCRLVHHSRDWGIPKIVR